MTPLTENGNGNGADGDDEREVGDEEDEEEEDEDDAEEEEEEPRLKYQRMGGSVPSLLSTDAAASISVAERMIALGTHDGTVHILDFLGNQVKSNNEKEFSTENAINSQTLSQKLSKVNRVMQVKEFASHTATVNDICFDLEGEYIASCSDDGLVVINSLFTDERLKFEYHRPMKAIALDPEYSQKN